MKKRANQVAALTLWTVALSILAAPRADADPNMVLHARAVDRPTIHVVIDTDQGPRLFPQVSEAFSRQFAGTDWGILDNNSLVISKNGKAVLEPVRFLTNKRLTSFLLHHLSPKLSVHGSMWRVGDDLKEGGAELFLTQLADDGRTFVTFYINVNLRFAPEGGASSGSSGQ